MKKIARVALFVALGGLLGACGGSDEQSSTGSTSAEGSAAKPTSVTIASSVEPKDGGGLVYGVESDVTGFSPYLDRWTISGRLMGWGIYDTLAAVDVEGVAKPFLAESIEPNADYTEWTITVRPDVEFSNGTPLTSAAITAHFENLRASFITNAAIAPVESWEAVDDRTTVVRMSSPWIAFPAALTGQGGAVPAPDQAVDQLGAAPIGTGPFVLGERTPEASTTLRRNANYWQAGLPHLDEVVFQIEPSQQDRVQGLLSGDLDVAHTSNGVQNRTVLAEAAEGNLQALVDGSEQEEAMVLINTAAEPVDDLRVRQAMAYAIDTDRYLAASGADPDQLASGAFVASSPWAADGLEFPRDDLAKAKALIADVEAEGTPVVFTFNLPDAPEYQDLAQEMAAMWTEAGMEVKIESVDQNMLVNLGVAGKYQVNMWRQFGQPDPDADAHFWFSPKEGDVSLNFSRFSNEEMDAALLEGRTNPDPEARKAAYGTVQEIWARELPYLWLSHARWIVAANNDVRDLASGQLPDGSPAQPFFNGSHRLSNAWLDR